MSENIDPGAHEYLRMSGRSRLGADILALMMKGAGYALLFCFVLLIAGWVLVGISRLLPPESKEAWDPNAFLLPPPPTVQTA